MMGGVLSPRSVFEEIGRLAVLYQRKWVLVSRSGSLNVFLVSFTLCVFQHNFFTENGLKANEYETMK